MMERFYRISKLTAKLAALSMGVVVLLGTPAAHAEPSNVAAETATAIMHTANRLANEWGVDPSNPVLVAGVSVLAMRWGVGKLWNLRVSDKLRRQARDQVGVNNALREFFADIHASNQKLADKAGAVMTAADRANLGLKPCARSFPLIVSAGTGIGATLAGGAGIYFAYNKAREQNKTIKELQAEENAKTLHVPLMRMNIDEHQREAESLQVAIKPAADRVSLAISPFLPVLKSNFHSNIETIAASRQRPQAEQETEIAVALKKLSDAVHVQQAFQLALAASLDEGIAANETREKRLKRLASLDRNHPEYRRFVESTTQRFVLASLSDVIKTDAQYTEFLKEVTREKLAKVVDEAIQSLK